MANIKSAKKRVLTAERNRLRNKSWKSRVRTCRNHVEEAVKSADAKAAAESLSRAYQIIDRAVSKGVVHRTTAARRKSQLAKMVVGLAK